MKSKMKLLTLTAIAMLYLLSPQISEAQSYAKIKPKWLINHVNDTEREYGKAYVFKKKLPLTALGNRYVVDDYIHYLEFGNNEAKQACEEAGMLFLGIDKRFMLRFIPKDESEAYHSELAFKFMVGDNLQFFKEDKWMNRNVRGSDFKNRGSVYVYTGYHFEKMENAYWTGGVNNGMLDGKGDGYVVTKEGSDNIYYSFSGVFKNGYPCGNVNMGVCKPAGVRYGATFFEIRTGESYEGYKSFQLNKKIGFFDEQNKMVIPPMYDEIRTGFSGGLAIVKYGPYWIKINKQNKCVEFIPGQDAKKDVIPRQYFTNGIFDRLKKLEIPKVKTVRFYACRYMDKLEELTFVEGLKVIEFDAFAGCSSLKKVTLPSSCTQVQINAFKGCDNLTTVIVPETFNYNDGENKIAFHECPNVKTLWIKKKDGKIVEDTEWYTKMQQNLKDHRQKLAWEKEKEEAENREFERQYSQHKELVKNTININTIFNYIVKQENNGDGNTYYKFKNIVDGDYQTIDGEVRLDEFGCYWAYGRNLIFTRDYCGNYKSLAKALVAIYYDYFGCN